MLKYHVVAGAAVKAADLKNGQLVKTLDGPSVAVDLSGPKPKVGGATVTMADVEASNGVIHVIDKVLLPPGDIIEVATAAGNFTRRDDEGYSFVYRQPADGAEEGACLAALEECPVEAIGIDGAE